MSSSSSTARRGFGGNAARSLCLFLTFLSSSQSFAPLALTRKTRILPPSLRLSMSSREQDTNSLPMNSTEAAFGINFDDSSSVNESHKRERQTREWWKDISQHLKASRVTIKPPPMQIDDPMLLYYDIFLILNLVTSISFWVVHRLEFQYIPLAFNEGCLLSILWVVSGLYHGAFLYSAVDGHASTSMDSSESDESNPESPWWEFLSKTKGGPAAAGLLALNTFINTISLRLIVALIVAVVEHRPVFDDPLEQLIPMEVGFGLILMSSWRTIHSASVTRM